MLLNLTPTTKNSIEGPKKVQKRPQMCETFSLDYYCDDFEAISYYEDNEVFSDYDNYHVLASHTIKLCILAYYCKSIPDTVHT